MRPTDGQILDEPQHSFQVDQFEWQDPSECSCFGLSRGCRGQTRGSCHHSSSGGHTVPEQRDWKDHDPEIIGQWHKDYGKPH